MSPTFRLGSAFPKTTCFPIRSAVRLHGQKRSIATHTYNHHASTLSVLPTNVDKSSTDYQENARQMGEAMARMQELHHKIEAGGSAKARDKHIARGKMLPREYVGKLIGCNG